MEIILPIFHDLTLTITDKPDEQNGYPTSRLGKGLLMSYQGQNLAEEAVGFGLPVLKQGLQTFFPGDIQLNLLHRNSSRTVTAIYKMNMVEKMAKRGTSGVNGRYLYAAKNFLAGLIRQCSPLRLPLTALSSALRRSFGWETIYEDAGGERLVKLTYILNESAQDLQIEADPASIPQPAFTELIVMNEQGAHFFDQYRDSSGTRLYGKNIGCWDEVTAQEAGFVSSTVQIGFSLPRVAGTRLFRGRELVDSRLAWAGFGYSSLNTTRGFRYTLKFEKISFEKIP